jgi:hypothetical protein
MKGSSPAGNTTSTTINPTQQMQQPFLQGGWNSALNLMNNFPKSYYPNTTLANYLPPDPLLTSGYQNTYNAGQYLQNQFLPGFQQNYQSMAGYAPQIAGYAGQAAANNNPALNSLMSTAGGGGPGMAELAKAASGYYVGSNPYLAGAIDAAQRPTERAYQTSVAPTIDAALSTSGRYGSGAQAGMYDTSQQNLSKALGDISTNMSNLNYGRERQLQDDAARGYVSGENTAGAAGGGLYNQGLQLGAQGTGNASDAARQYAALWPTLSSAMMAAPQAELQAGQGLTNIEQMGRQYEQQQIDDQKARFYGNQQAPYDTLSAYLNNIGQPTTGTTQTQQPYFQNQASSLLSAGLGLTGLGRNLGLFGSGSSGGLGGLGGTLGSLFGGGGAALDVAGVAQSAAGLGAATGLDASTLMMMGLI